MLNQNQKRMIVNTPTFRITQTLVDGSKLSVTGQRGKGFIEMALIDTDGSINHNPPFAHDGFGIATFSRDEANQISDLIDRIYKKKLQLRLI